MKKLISSLLLLCIGFPAVLAQAAPDYVSIVELRDEVADGWHQTYEAHGRTIRMEVDRIVLPDVDRIPILQVAGVEALSPDRLSTYAVAENLDNRLAYSVGGIGINNFYDGNKMLVKQDRVYTSEDIDLSYHADGNDLSIQEAIDIVIDSLERAYGEELSEVIKIQSARVDGKVYKYDAKCRIFGDPIDHPDNIGRYELQFWQTLQDVPVLCTGGGSFNYLKNDVPYLFSSISAGILDSEEYGVNANLVKTTMVVQDDSPLRPFKDIKQTLEALIEEGRVRSIEDIRLGYVLYCDSEKAEINWAIPTWVCRAEFYDDADQEPYLLEDPDAECTDVVPRKGNVLIQAQTGLFIDPLDMTPTRRNAPKVIAWDDVK